MSESKLAIEVAAVLEEFSANQRAQGIAQARLQKIVFARQVGDGQVQFEAVIDETADASEIYTMLNRIDAASNRLKAARDLECHYDRLLNLCNQIEMSQNALSSDQARFRAENAKRNSGKREAQPMPASHQVILDQHETAIRDAWAKIDDLMKAVTECRRVIGGADQTEVMGQQVRKRVDELRGSRLAVA